MALFTTVGFTNQEKVDLKKKPLIICLLRETRVAVDSLDNSKKSTVSKPSKILRKVLVGLLCL